MYGVCGTAVVLVQQRAPSLIGQEQHFARDLLELLASVQTSLLLVMCGANLEAVQHDEDTLKG